MRAMTEMPANTPSPIGSTESCLPGSTNACVALADDDGAESAAELGLAPADDAAVADAASLEPEPLAELLSVPVAEAEADAPDAVAEFWSALMAIEPVDCIRLSALTLEFRDTA
jgi:hypothetical protein